MENIELEEILSSCMKDGIVIMDELLKVADFNQASIILNKYPIHYYEMLWNWYSSKDYRSIFRFAVDHDLRELIKYIIREEQYYLENELVDCWQNRTDLKEIVDLNLQYIKKENLYCHDNYKDMLKMIKKAKKNVLEKMAIDEKKINEQDTLTREYFKEQLSKENFKMVAIELCVKLEFILNVHYGFEGTLDDMLKAYSTTNECGLLYKLKEYRNDIVHFDKNGVQLSLDELEKCIDIIFSMTNKGGK